MGKDKKGKKKCCGKFIKKGTHCSSCPVTTTRKKCKSDKSYCDDCEVKPKTKKEKKVKNEKQSSAKKKKKKK